MELPAAQRTAVDHVRQRALAALAASTERIDAVLARAGLDVDPAELAGGAIRQAPLALNFHPDRIASDGRLVADALLEDGIYRSQFETGISNGGLTAFPGGDRDSWERALFGEAYHVGGVAPADRPKYGGLNLMDHADGPCPRFGSCHLVLSNDVIDRATFCFGDSFGSPPDVGTADEFGMIVAAMLERAEQQGAVVGRRVSVPGLVELLMDLEPGRPGRSTEPGRGLDDYIEAQVHGLVRLDTGAVAVAADPSFRDTPIGTTVENMARRYRLALTWHQGFELDAAEVPDDFRGPRIPLIAQRINQQFGDGSTALDAERIGRAARSVVISPDDWADWGSPAETLQHIKQLWHVLVAFGASSTRR